MNTPADSSRGAPLAGVRVLDLTRLLPGPIAAMHLADLGADVIKIEDTGAGDYAIQPVRALVNRNKRGLRLDLKQPAGRDALLQLCRGADVLVEGFRPGVMARLGLGYDELAAANPKLVMCSISGWGASGPLRDLPGHDINYTALTGVADQMGGLSNLPIGDLLGGSLTAVMGVLAALFDAARTGRGRHVDIAIADGVLAHAVLPMAALAEHGHVQRPGEGALTGALACYGLYDTADDRQLAVGALERKFWDALCACLARPDLAPLHRSGDAPTEARVRAELTAVFATQPLTHWAALFADVPACVTPVLRLDETLAHPHFQARGMAPAGRPARFGCPVQMTGFAPGTPRPAPRAGEHSDEVLAEAGFSAGDIAALRAGGVLGPVD